MFLRQRLAETRGPHDIPNLIDVDNNEYIMPVRVQAPDDRRTTEFHEDPERRFAWSDDDSE